MLRLEKPCECLMGFPIRSVMFAITVQEVQTGDKSAKWSRSIGREGYSHFDLQCIFVGK